MKEALKLAIKAKGRFEVPVGSIIVKNHKIIGTGFNENISKHTVSAHAEIIAINSAGAFLENYRLNGCDIYVTLEPCHMCAKAIVNAGIDEVLYAEEYRDCSGVKILQSSGIKVGHFKPQHNM